MTPSLLDNATIPEQFSTDLSKPALVTLEHLTCYQVSGEDAQAFLQGQLSNDINAVTPNTAQLTSYSTPKGRMLATFYICHFQENYILIISSDIAQEVMKRLQMFVLRSKVEIKKYDDGLLLGLCDNTDSKILEFFELERPEANYQCSNNNSLACIKIPGTCPRYIIVGEALLNEQINSLDNNNFEIFSSSYWQWLDIMSGIPNITQATQEAFVPQMANMELIDGVSFSKGCYPGQEIVARLHYLGNSNRRMFRIEVHGEEINPGDNIYSKDSDQAIGQFINTIKESQDTYSGLAVVRIEAVKKNQLTAGSPSGSPVQIMPLPYDVPTKSKEKAS